MIYATVILPLKLNKELTYSVPVDLEDRAVVGARVIVPLVNKKYHGIISKIKNIVDYDSKKIKSIIDIDSSLVVSEKELRFWAMLSSYYMCSIGQVFKAVMPAYLTKSIESKRKNIKKDAKSDTLKKSLLSLNELTEAQKIAYNDIKSSFQAKKVVLLNGVTGSGKTEIYMKLMKECLDEGKDVLYLLPEIAISKQLSKRIEKHFGKNVNVYHSRQSIARKRDIWNLISQNARKQPTIVLGLRSALFLPYTNLGLIIVDEEHDSSYKQTDSAPRYNGRDAAIMLGSVHDARVLLGSGTPSFESLYNVHVKKFSQVLLSEKYNQKFDARVEVIDMKKEYHKKAVKGSFSLTLIDHIKETLERGEQVLLFRSRRAYSSMLQCADCGEVPKCPRCNIHMTYHKYNNSFECHYCGYKTHNISCPKCGSTNFNFMGAGTEKIEEELHELFPEYNIARYDADTAKKKKDADKILNDFAKGRTNILIGTQMLSKGFDFSNLTLVAVVNADTILSVNDFRADEKALQLLSQLRGRAGRRDKNGLMLIQTMLSEHPVFKVLVEGESIVDTPILSDRKDFDYPPFVRIVDLIIKDKYPKRMNYTAGCVSRILNDLRMSDYLGPIAPPIDKIGNEYIVKFQLKFHRNRASEILKAKILSKISTLEHPVIIDVDPLR